jgi:hypothetical protein
MDDDVLAYVMTRLEADEASESTVLDPSMNVARVFKWWLWIPDANEDVVRYVFTLNTVHLTGVYLSRELNKTTACNIQLSARELVISVKAASQDTNASLQAIFIPHADKAYETLTLRQYRDVVESIQWQWNMFIEPSNRAVVDIVSEHLDALFSLLGHFLSVEREADMFDDDDSTELITGSNKLRQLNITAVKMFVHIFYILYRSLFLKRICTWVDPASVQAQRDKIEIHNFHVEASLDDYYNLTMFYDIAPGCLLDYKHAFTGFYNSVSQVVYRHYPCYKRKKQETVENINEFLLLPGHDVHMLPCLRQLYPDIEYAWEDHHFDVLMLQGTPATGASTGVGTGIENRGKKCVWRWLCIAGDFFLVNDSGRVYASDNVVTLTAFYMTTLPIV